MLQIRKFISNKKVYPSFKSYTAIIGLAPSKGARSPALWNAAFKGYKIQYIDRKVRKTKYQLKINLYNNQSPSIEDNYKLKKNSIIINFINLKYNNKYHILIKHEKNKIISDLIGNSFNQNLIPSIEYYHNNLYSLSLSYQL